MAGVNYPERRFVGYNRLAGRLMAVVDATALADRADQDSPPLTDAQMAQLRPLGDLLPMLSTGKTRITIMLDDAVLKAYRARWRPRLPNPYQ